MDFLYHAAIGLGISKTIGGSYDPYAAVFALLPDLIGITPFAYLKLKNDSHDSFMAFITNSFNVTKVDIFFTSFDRSLYRTTHSLLFTALLTIFLYLLFPQTWLIYSLSYLSHILVDVPTHDGEFATRLLYPISDIHYQGKNWAKNKRIFTILWGLLLAILLISLIA
jgi:membrane-bound metal-dependent hydrolase YbcI (DUF457 family)